MTDDSKHNNPASDDIDLLLLIERVLFFFRRYLWIFLTATVLGLSSGLFMYNFLPNIYKSRMVAHSFVLTNQEEIKIIENWNALLDRNNYAELSTALNCPENVFARVKKISAEEIQKVFSTTNPNGYVIDVNVTDNAILDDLQKAIVYGLENTEYVKQRLAFQRASLTELIDKTGQEIIKLDSTKKAMENIIEGRGKSSSSLIIEGATINNQLIEMNAKFLGYRQELRFTAAVQVLQGFSKFSQPAGPHLFPWLFIGLLVFLPLGFLLSFVSAIYDKLKSRTRLSNQAIQKKNV